MIPFTIADLLMNTGVDQIEASEPKLHNLSDPQQYVFQATVQTDNRVLIQSYSPDKNYFQGLRLMLDIWSEDFKRLRHDIVGSLGAMTTDVPFSAIDPSYDDTDAATHEKWHRLTPDFWVPQNRTLAELGTSMSLDPHSLMRDYESKWLKYKTYADLANVSKYFVFLVGQNHVISNYPLSQLQIDELCMRCRLGIALETNLIEQLGENKFVNEDQSYKEKLVESVLRQIGRSEKEDVDFNHDLAEFSLEPMTAEELIYVNKKIVSEFIATGKSDISEKTKLTKYLSGFTDENTRNTQYLKRVCNFPFVTAYRSADTKFAQLTPPDILNLQSLPGHLRPVWTECFTSDSHVPLPEDEEVAMNESESYARGQPMRHKLRKHHSFIPSVSASEKIELALRGIEAKNYTWDKHMKSSLEEDQHKGFHPNANTDDIAEFLESNCLERKYILPSDMILPSLLRNSKAKVQEPNEFINSVDLFQELIYSSELICFADVISNSIQEIMLACKTFMNKGQYMFKYLRYYKVAMIVKNTGSHVFVSYIFQKDACAIIDTGRLGPELYDVGTHWISDWCSYDSIHLEHYMKCGPLMASVMSHYLAMFKIDVSNLEQVDLYSKGRYPQFWYTLKMSLLIFLNNKLDVEELLTAQRYLIMNVLDEVAPDPYRFVQRLPEVLRSRLTSFLTTRCIDLINYYAENKVQKGKITDTLGGKKSVYFNLKSIVCRGVVTIEQSIELFYVGYLVSKNRSSGAYASFTICKKLFKEEFKYLDNREKGKRVIDNIQTGSSHQADRIMFKFYVTSFEKIMRRVIGPNHKEITARDVINRMSKTTFLDLATLKASARPWQEDYDINSMDEPENFQDAMKKLKSLDASSFRSRPKAILAISTLMEDYKAAKGSYAEHIVELIPFCLDRLEVKGGFESDLFSKDQHGGIREITVLEIAMRVLQYFIEILSRVVCKYFPSETLTSPEEKEKFIPRHYSNFSLSHSDFLTLCTSGDKKTWCQGHHSIRFANMLTGIMHSKFHNMIYRILGLWIDKRVKLPSDLVGIFLANEHTPSTDPIFTEMRDRFYSGKAPFINKASQTVCIRGGMFQGLLHYASSVQHTMCQEVGSVIQIEIWDSITQTPIKITVAQGSDDYAVLYSLLYDEVKTPRQLRLLHRLIKLRARLTHLTGITESDKSASCNLDVVEYNSEWTIARSITRPTLKWSIASMEISLVESFITRLRQFSNNLTQLLEGGASTLECALVQLSQAWLHYKLLGLDQHYHYETFANLIMKVPDPVAGYFPLEADLTCGLTGLDYILYNLARNSGFGTIIAGLETVVETDKLDYNDRKSKSLNDESTSLLLKFGNLKKWERVVEDSGLPDLEECHSFFNEHPEQAFVGHSSWEEDRLSVALKLHSPGVRSSLAGHQPLLRMMVASSYVLNRACFQYSSSSIEENLKKKKWTLLQVLKHKEYQHFIQPDKEVMENSLRKVFPRWQEYDKLRIFEVETNRSMFLESSEFKRRGKVLLEIFPDPTTDSFPLISMCKRKWFELKHTVKVGSDFFKELWEKTKEKYPFIKDTIQETLVETGLNVIQLKFYLESTSQKGRRVKLMDTTAKTQSLYSTITRIFWDTIKIRSYKHATVTQGYLDLRSNIFSILNFALRDFYMAGLITELLKNSDELKDENSQHLPTASKGLKLIRDIITNSISRDMAVKEITSLKDGTIGWFSVRQEFDKERGHRCGIGEWRGKIGKVSVILSLWDNQLTRILVNSLVDSDRTSLGLGHLIRDLRLKVPEDTPSSYMHFYYKPRTGLIRSEVIPKSCVPLVVEQSLSIDRFDNIDKTNWNLECTPYGLRLINIDGVGNKAVLFSEKFSAKDWDKDSNWLLDADTPLHYWHRGKPLPLSAWGTLTRGLGALNTHGRSFLKHARFLRRSSSVGAYDLTKLENLFVKYFQDPVSTTEERLKFLDLDIRHEQIDRSVTHLNFDVQEFLKELSDPEKFDYAARTAWDMPEITESVYEVEGLNLDTVDEAVNNLKLFSELDPTIPHEVLDELSVGMPYSNNFFSALNNALGNEYPNVDLHYLLVSDTPFENPYGVILSYLSGRDKRIPDPFYDDWSNFENTSDDVSIGTGLSAVSSIARQQAIVMSLREEVPKTSGVAHTCLTKELRRQQTRLDSMLGVEVDLFDTEDLRDLKKRDFTIKLFDFLSIQHMCPLERNSTDTDDDIYNIRIVSHLYTHIGEISNIGSLEQDILDSWLTSLRRLEVTHQYLALLADVIECDISLVLDGKIMMREMYNDEIESDRRNVVYSLTRNCWRIAVESPVETVVQSPSKELLGSTAGPSRPHFDVDDDSDIYVDSTSSRDG